MHVEAIHGRNDMNYFLFSNNLIPDCLILTERRVSTVDSTVEMIRLGNASSNIEKQKKAND